MMKPIKSFDLIIQGTPIDEGNLQMNFPGEEFGRHIGFALGAKDLEPFMHWFKDLFAAVAEEQAPEGDPLTAKRQVLSWIHEDLPWDLIVSRPEKENRTAREHIYTMQHLHPSVEKITIEGDYFPNFFGGRTTYDHSVRVSITFAEPTWFGEYMFNLFTLRPVGVSFVRGIVNIVSF